MKKKKYFYIYTSEHVGERSFGCGVVAAIGIKACVDRKADRIAQNWYEDDDSREKTPTGYNFDCGAIGVEVDSIQEITKEHFDVLSQYLAVL